MGKTQSKREKRAKSTPTKPDAEEPAPEDAGRADAEPAVEKPAGSSKEGVVEDEPTDFESLYLKQVTEEFADDIDKLRKAGDFTDRSVPILVDALRQGASLFSEEDRRKLMGEERK